MNTFAEKAYSVVRKSGSETLVAINKYAAKDGIA